MPAVPIHIISRDVRLGGRAFYAATLLALFAAYAGILAITFGFGLAELMGSAAANIMPIALLGAAVRAILRGLLLARPVIIQSVAHVALAISFTMLLYWLVMVLLGVVSGRSVVEFNVTPFRSPAAVWQLFQGLIIYALIAVLVHAEALAEKMRATSPEVASQESDVAPARLFVRLGEDIRPLDPSRIILIRGADDYAELVTASGTHLVRMTLATLGERLGARFIRVHRSLLVNVDRIGRAEPAGGGRMLLHMENGEMVTASRSGTRLLRERVI